ncbi:ABC transporter ATP-binding protein [Fictibacillus phosphorivorans]|uniref:ABC transporter ATP-binding protein n=1 Tax=Fictibacillus phosphorivorans TaxID=1221500 RepID=UPI00203BE4A4|nr:ABC transporter ATP-binding protein [Fictibacillus phosphorivorans]MCM3718204.1 ABC transporter ATP-binding protein [Fictibacillus phosphorivorans]MCM3775929.1 ABC transporter ATP-binding protein [Fictibacillus phosphorivorans]
MISVSNLSYAFKIGKKGKENIIPVLHDVNLQVAEGEIVAVVGRSGSGKSTLLNLISGFIQSEVGSITINGTDVSKFSESKWAEFRLNHLGFIFQSFQLIPSMSAFENVELPLVLKGVSVTERKKKAEEMLKRVGLESFQHHYPGELSGGQQQRVSIARALILNPPLILADEPTGSLDSENEKQLLSFVKELNEKYGITFLMITHDHEVASIAHRKVEIIDGYLREEKTLHEVQR